MRAPLLGMLRITPPSSNTAGAFILQGRLTGLWARELLRIARTHNQGYRHTFDLQKVTFVDVSGEEVLRLLAARGATFITDSTYGKCLCNRLRLDRVSPFERANDNGKSGKAHANALDTSAAVNADQRPSNCGD